MVGNLLFDNLSLWRRKGSDLLENKARNDTPFTMPSDFNQQCCTTGPGFEAAGIEGTCWVGLVVSDGQRCNYSFHKRRGAFGIASLCRSQIWRHGAGGLPPLFHECARLGRALAYPWGLSLDEASSPVAVYPSAKRCWPAKR